MKKATLLLFTFVLALSLTACGSKNNSAGGSTKGEKGTVGIAMPTKSSERWVNDGNNMVKEFQSLGYGTDLQYG